MLSGLQRRDRMQATHEDILFSGGPIRAEPGRLVEALLIRDGRVVAAGSHDEVRAVAGRARRVDLAGRAVTAGIVDAHVHLTAWSLARRRADLTDCRSLDEVSAIVRSAASGSEGWIRGQGWQLERLDAEPVRGVLDAAAPGRPVFLESNDLHAAWLSTAALDLLGLGPDTPDPEGGALVRDADTGALTGVLLETAKTDAQMRVPGASLDEIDDAVLEGQGVLHRLGITGVHSVEPEGLGQVLRLRERDRLTLRVLQHLPLERLEEAARTGVRSGFGDDLVRIGGVKMFMDGTLGSRTAWLRDPYEGSDDDRGICTLQPEDFRDAVCHAAAAGLATTVHAIGDAAVAQALDVLSEVPAPAFIPHRIEHLQLCPPDLWDRAAKAGIVASMQPVHLRTDIPSLDPIWGRERSRGAYAFAPLLEAGTVLAFGSDAPVETPDPREGLMAAVRRVAREGGAEYYPEHALSPEEALAGYTIGPALAERRAHRRGRLLPGFDADLVVWSADPVTTPPEALPDLECVLTMVGGAIVHGEPR
jgi:predicted amidohydrolase YtcJ